MNSIIAPITIASLAILATLTIPLQVLQSSRTYTPPPTETETETLPYKLENFQYLECIQSIHPTEDTPPYRLKTCGTPPPSFR